MERKKGDFLQKIEQEAKCGSTQGPSLDLLGELLLLSLELVDLSLELLDLGQDSGLIVGLWGLFEKQGPADKCLGHGFLLVLQRRVGLCH